MEQALLVLTFGAYGILLLILFVYGVNFMYLTWMAARPSGADPALPSLTRTPYVGVHLPIYNELYVAERFNQRGGAIGLGPRTTGNFGAGRFHR